jgi:hypothetical protein
LCYFVIADDITHRDTGLLQLARHRLSVQAELLRELVNGSAAFVFFDKPVHFVVCETMLWLNVLAPRAHRTGQDASDFTGVEHPVQLL